MTSQEPTENESKDPTENPRRSNLAFQARALAYEAERMLVMRQNGQPSEDELRDFLFQTMQLLRSIAAQTEATVKPIKENP